MNKKNDEYLGNPITQPTHSIPLIYSLLKSVVNRVISIFLNKQNSMFNYNNFTLPETISEKNLFEKLANQNNCEDFLKPDVYRVIYAISYFSLFQWFDESSTSTNQPALTETKLANPPNYIDSINSVVNRVKNKTSLSSKVNLNLSQIKFLYTNATSLANKWNEFNSLINFLDLPHIIMITETWFNDKSITNLSNYKAFIKNRGVVRGGGVAIYVRNDLRAFDITDEILNFNYGEMIWCRVQTDNESIIVGCMYRPPHAQRETNVEIIRAIGRAKSLCDKKIFGSLIIAGDFNHSDIDWSNGCGICRTNGRPSSLDMIDCLNTNLLSQLVNQPTFLSNTLDLVITNDPTRIYQVQNGPPLGSTKNNQLHCTLTWDFLLRSGKIISSEARLRRNYMKGNYDTISDLLAKTFTQIRDFNVNDAYGELVSTYTKAIESYIPTTKVKNANIKPNPKWFNSKVKRATSQKYKLYCKLRSSPKNIELKYLYTSACKHVKLLVKASVLEYEGDLIKKCKNNPKLLYSYING